jgi:hypothetical protein
MVALFQGDAELERIYIIRNLVAIIGVQLEKEDQTIRGDTEEKE